MHILLFSDFHNAIDVNTLTHKLAALPPLDAVFTLGDISIADLAAIKDLIPSTPIYGLRGNHDTPNALEYAGIENIHGKAVTVSGVRFAGFDGSVRYKRGSYVMYTQKESLNIADALPSSDILISHDRAFIGREFDMASEFTTNPHEGLCGIASYLSEKRPLLHIHGHIHKNNGYRFKGIDTISVYGAVSVSISSCGIEEYTVLQEP